MGTLGRPKAEVVEALRELGYGSFGLHGWRYAVRTTHKAAVTAGRAAVERTKPRPPPARENELAVATAIGVAVIGAAAAVVGVVAHEMRPARGGTVAGLIVGALGFAAMLALGRGRGAYRR